jgi:hypothetical protein
MTRLLFTALLCTLGAAQASAQNGVSQRLLELDDGERNGAFTLMLRDSNRTCDGHSAGLIVVNERSP